METPETIRLSLKTEEWVISLDFSNAYFHIPIAPRSRKYLRFFLFHQTFQFTALPFGLATAPLEFTKIVKEVKLMAQARGIRIHQYLDDWLLRAPSPEICLQHTQTLLALCQQLGWVVNMNKSDLVPKQVFNFVGYLFNLITGRVLPTQDRWEALQKKLRFTKAHHQCTVRQLMSLIGLLTATEKQVSAGRLHMRPIQWHLKKNWQAYSGPSVTASSFRLVVRRGKCPNRSTLTPSSARSSTVYRRLKRRLGRSLRGLHCKRRLVSFRKSPSHKLSRTKGSPASSEAVRTSMQEQDCAGVNRQYDSCFVHKQARGYEVRLSLCSPLEASVLVPSQGHIPASQTHSGPFECDSRQTFQAQPGNPNRVVPVSTGVQSVVLQVDPSRSGLVCNQIQSQTTQFCVTGSGSESLGGGRSEPFLGTAGRLCIPSSIPASPSSLKTKGSGLSQDDSGCPRLAKHALVLGPGGPIGSDPVQPSSNKGPSNSAF